MRKRRIIPLVAVIACLIVGMTIATRPNRKDTVFRGQSLQTWTVRGYQGDSNAVATLKELGTNAIPQLINLLKTRDSFLRRQMWAHLPKFPQRLRRTIAQKYPPPQAETVREAAARALGRLGEDAKPAIPALSRALRDNQGRVRWEAATALVSIGKDSLPALMEALEEGDGKMRHAAAYALGELGPDAVTAVPALTKALEDPDQSIRNSAAYSLTMMGAPGFLALLDAMEHGAVLSRNVAARTLTNSHLPHFKACSTFLQMTRDESPAKRQQAIEALAALSAAGSLAVHASLEALHDPALEVRLAAIKTLGAKGGNEQSAVQALTGCLQDDSARIREAAAQALESINARGANGPGTN